MSRDRIWIFVLSFGVKAMFALLFFGSVDIINSIELTINAAEGDGSLIATLPYLPVVPILHWVVSELTHYIPMPVGFAYKLLPVVYDSFLAILVYDIALARNVERPLTTGLLYAVSPIAIIITSLHGQVDSIFLFFLIWALWLRETRPLTQWTASAFGLIMGLSILIKPVAVIFAPFLLMPRNTVQGVALLRQRDFFRFNLLAAATAFFVLAGFILLFQFMIRDWGQALLHIFLYANTGYPVAGLPMAPLLQGVEFLHSRIWMVALILILAGAYLVGRIDYGRAVLIVFLLIPGIGGYAPQYLLWPMAILLMLGFVRLSALYTLASTTYLILFYLSPAASHKMGENVAIFAPLKSVSSMAPPADWFGDQYMAGLAHLGNYGIPVLCLSLICFVWRAQTRPINIAGTDEPAFIRWHQWPCELLAFSLILYWLVSFENLNFALSPVIASGHQAYAMIPNGRYFIPVSGGSWVNILSSLLVLTASWCAAAWRAASNR